MNLNLHLLRVFFTVAEQRSFSRAAEVLFISQPAVSKAVRELESQLDLPLIERGAGGPRSAKGVQLTENGQALVEHARGIFALERAAAEDIQARLGLQRGQLVVGASSTIAGYWLPAYAAGFLRQFPAAGLRVVTGNTQAICQALIECEVDVALVEGAVDDARIDARPWREDELRIVAAPGAAQGLKRKAGRKELNEQVWLMREPGSGTRAVTERMLALLGIEPKRLVEFGSNEGIARAVAAGMGVALLPERVLRELLQVGELELLPNPGATRLVRPLYLLQLKERPPSPLVRAFCAALQAPPPPAGSEVS